MLSAQTQCLVYEEHLQMVTVTANYFQGSTMCKIACLFLPIPLPGMRLKLTLGNSRIGRWQRRFEHGLNDYSRAVIS